MRFSMVSKNKFLQVSTILAVLLLATCICCIMESKVACAETPTVGLIASFTTYYGESSAGRKHNVALACSLIDGITLYPEDEFSFNSTVGKRTEERGFKSAYIIKNGEFVEGVGGGVCQVSSTLYNAVLLADLTVTKVSPHSLPVSYVSPSFDAMVSSGSDLRFVNTLNAPVTIKASADGKYVKCEIYGVAGRKVRRVSETLETIPNETVYVDDESLPMGQESVDSYGHVGLKSVGYLEYVSDGKCEKVLIRRDTYAPQKRIILRGTKEEKDTHIDTKRDSGL